MTHVFADRVKSSSTVMESDCSKNSKKFHNSVFWLWSCLLVLWHLFVFYGFSEQVIKATGVKYREEDAIFVGVYYGLVSILLGLALSFFCSKLEKKSRSKSAYLVFTCTQVLFGFLTWFNLRIFATVGVHVVDRTFLEKILEPQIGEEMDLGAAAVAEFCLRFGQEFLVVLLFGIISWKLWNYFSNTKTFLFRKFANVFHKVSLFLTVFFLMIWPLAYSLKAWSAIPVLTALPMFDYWSSTKALAKRAVKYDPQIVNPKLNGKTLVLIGIETFRFDSWSQSRMPLTWKLFSQHKHKCVSHTRHYAPSSVTESGIFTLLYGINSNYYREFRKLRLSSYAIDYLKLAGYKTETYASGKIKTWSDSNFVFENFDKYEESSADSFCKSDLAATDNLINAVLNGDKNKFIFGFWSSPHSNYYFPPNFEIHKPVVPEKFQGLESHLGTEVYRKGVKNRYLNAVLYTDFLIHRVLTSLMPKILKGEVEVVLTGDHGEEFWDHGQLGHASARFYSERIRVPLFWCGSLKAIDPNQVTSHIDILPTLFLSAGASPDDLKQFVSGIDLNRNDLLKGRPFVINVSMAYPQKSHLLSVIGKDHNTYWIADRWTGFELYQVTNDKDEILPITDSLKSNWQSWLEDLRKNLNQFSP